MHYPEGREIIPTGEGRMARNREVGRPHYHIRWDRKKTLDWECFNTFSEASIRAAQLAGPYEMFTIEEVSSDCRLRKAVPLRTAEARRRFHHQPE